MKCGRIMLIAVVLGLSQSAFAESQSETLCNGGEKVIFSCAITKKRIASACASPVLTADAGYMQYRIGTHRKLEFEFPLEKDHPKKHFLSGVLASSGGGGAYLKFTNANYSYYVITAIGAWGEEEGVDVKKANVRISFLKCGDSFESQIGPDFFWKAAIPADPAIDDYHIPTLR